MRLSAVRVRLASWRVFLFAVIWIRGFVGSVVRFFTIISSFVCEWLVPAGFVIGDILFTISEYSHSIPNPFLSAI